ncbi:MAG: fibronectin type III domain protein [Nitrospirae bacterium]|nr:MAG: fibronectin type III domain protein [Nitrospirota bacterium]
MKFAALSSLLFALCLIVLCSLLSACGKKEPPTLKAYEKPDAPSGLKAIHRENNIILSWSYNKKENLKEFYILRAEDSSFQKIAPVTKEESSYTDVNFKTGALYKYKVVAGSLKKILSDDSNIIAVKPLAVPPAPQNVSFLVGNDALSISWEGARENILYNIYRSSEKGKYSITPINNEPIKTTSYSDNFDMDKTVYYTVRGALNNEYRNEGPASDEIEVNPVDFIPSRPEGLQAIFAGDKAVISWKENPEVWVKKYRVYRKTNEEEGFKLAGEPVTPAFTDREKTGTKHVYKITAVGPSKESEFSGAVAVDF